MRTIVRRIERAETQAERSNFTVYDGMSEERQWQELHWLMGIIYCDVEDPVGEKIGRLLNKCTIEQFKRAWAAKAKRDAASASGAGDDATEDEAPVDISLKLADFINSGVATPAILQELEQPAPWRLLLAASNVTQLKYARQTP
jgi:hypothetical protein